MNTLYITHFRITSHPNVYFTVVVNPESGPGSSFPDMNYQREITKLNSFANVRTVGYVRTNYTVRPISEVKSDIDSYATWPSMNPVIYVDGIFFDEAPSSANQSSLAYMQAAVSYSHGKKDSGIGKNSTPYVVTNPGQPPVTAAYLNSFPAPDLVLVFENTYAAWYDAIEANRQNIWDLDADNNQLAVMLHDVPNSLTCSQITALVNDLKGNVGVGSLWLTDLIGDTSYTGWPTAPDFKKYIDSFENGGKAC